MKRVLFSVALALVFVTASTAGAQTCWPNMLTNPGFEDGFYDGWFTFGGGVQLSTPQDDDIYRNGTAASKIYGEFLGCPGTGSFTVGGYGQSFTPTAGKVYELSGYSFVSSADPIPGTSTCDDNRLIAKIVFFDQAVGGSELASNEVVIGDYTSTLDAWNHFTVSAPAPSGALRVEALFLFLQPACDTGAVYVDDAWFCESDPTPKTNLLANPSFTQSFTGWNTFGNAFVEGRTFGLRTVPASAKLFGTFVPNNDSGIFQRLDATAGAEYVFGGYSMTTCVEDPITGTNDNVCLGRVIFLDGAGAEIGSTDLPLLDNTAPLGTWTWHETTVTAPVGTDSVDVYVLFVSPNLLGGAVFVDDFCFIENLPTAVRSTPVPGAELYQNVPNPFNPTTQIGFELAKQEYVTLAVYDVSGRRIRTLQDGTLGPGPHSITWNGRTDTGILATSGVYYYVLETPAGRLARSMVLLK
jgi:hypothetical protein